MKIITLIFFLGLSLSSLARERNLEGKTLLNASVGIGYGEKEGLIVHAKPRLLRFVLPRLALGMDAEYYRENNYSRLGLGPSLDFHFFNLGDIDFVLGQNALYGKESTQTPGVIATTSLSANYSLTENFLFGVTFGKMYYLTKKDIKPKDPDFVNLAFIFIF